MSTARATGKGENNEEKNANCFNGFAIEALDTAFKIEAMSQKISKRKSPWKMACSFKGWSDETVKLYKINATLSTWLIDRKGFLRYYNLRGEELRQAIEKVIKES